ncbi:hypothetical protein [Chryseobacterium pennae]
MYTGKNKQIFTRSFKNEEHK